MNDEQMKRLQEAMTTADDQCRNIHRLILDNQFTWQSIPGPEGVRAFSGTGGGYTVVVGKGENSIIGSCFGGAPQLTVLRGEFALFCFEAAEAAQAKKN